MKEFLTVAKNLDIQELAKGIAVNAVNEDNTNIETEESSIEADDVGKPSKLDIGKAGKAADKIFPNA